MKNITVEEFISSESPESIEKKYFNSDRKLLHQWLYVKYQDILDARIEVEPANRKKWVWRGIELGIPNVGTREFIDSIMPCIENLRQTDSRDSFNELTRLKAWLKAECEFNKVENKNALDPWSSNYYKDFEFVDFALFEWENKKYLVWIEKIYNVLIKKIDIILKYYESGFPEWFIDNDMKSRRESKPNSIHTPTPEQTQNAQHMPPESPTKDIADVLKGVRWKERIGSKADLAELIKGLYYMKVIEKDGNPIELEDLQKIFESVFDIKIGDLDKSFRSRLESNKNIDNILFLDQAGNRLDEMYREMAKEIRKERQKTP